MISRMVVIIKRTVSSLPSISNGLQNLAVSLILMDFDMVSVFSRLVLFRVPVSYVAGQTELYGRNRRNLRQM